MDFFLRIILYIMPLYIANSSAMLLGGKTALDFGKKFSDGKEIFGKGKTWKGAVFGIIAGTTTAFFVTLIVPEQTAAMSANYMLFGFLLSAGAIFGDLAGSFLKRRLSIARGEPVLLLDQLDFIAGGLLLGGLMIAPAIEEIIFIIVITLMAHKLSNYIAFKIKLKKVPW